jgi:hypothetical protein
MLTITRCDKEIDESIALSKANATLKQVNSSINRMKYIPNIKRKGAKNKRTKK